MSSFFNNRSRRRGKTPKRNRLTSGGGKNSNTRRNMSSNQSLNQNPNIITKYISRLKELYPLCKHDSANESPDKYSGHRTTYGEMSYEGIEILYRHILQFAHPAPQYFLDVGSGRGKLCMYMASKPNVEASIGVELVTPRVNDAEQLKKELSRQYSIYTNKCTFLNSDVLQISFDNLFPNKTNKIFVWFSNLCFEPTTTDAIYSKLVSEITSGSIICSSKMPTSIPDTLQQLGTLIIPMSWSANSSVFVFQKR